MSTNGNGSKLLITFIIILWGVVAGFASLCIMGYFKLEAKADMIDIKRQETRERVAKLEECMISQKENYSIMRADIAEVKDNVKMILRRIK